MKLSEVAYGLAGLAGLGAVAFIVYQVKQLLEGKDGAAPEIPDGVFAWLFPTRLTVAEVAGYAYCWQLVEIGAIPPASYAAPPSEWAAEYLEWTEVLLEQIQQRLWLLSFMVDIPGKGLEATIGTAQAEDILDMINDVWGWGVPIPSWAS